MSRMGESRRQGGLSRTWHFPWRSHGLYGARVHLLQLPGGFVVLELSLERSSTTTQEYPMIATFEILEPRRLLAGVPDGNVFVQTNIVSDGAVTALHTDVDLKNP